MGLVKSACLSENANTISHDTKKISRQLFFRGFMKGLGAPALLFDTNALPPIPNVEFVSAPTAKLGFVLGGDWFKIGADLDSALRKHGKSTAKPNEKTTGQRR